jgi:hypothetical protein
MEKIIDKRLFRIDAALTEFRNTLAHSKPDEAAVESSSREFAAGCEAVKAHFAIASTLPPSSSMIMDGTKNFC